MTTWSRIRVRTASVLDVSEPGDRLSRLFDYLLIGLILLNFLAVILESVVSIRAEWALEFRAFEIFSVAIFTVEYVARVWSIVDSKWRSEYRHPVKGRLRFMVSPMAIVDLLAVAPFWLSMIFPVDLRFLRVLRLLRVLKLTRYSAAMNLLFDVVREKMAILAAALFIVFILVIVAASLTYLAEHEAQPQAFANIPQAIWWAVVTVTTVGYGDVVPITPMGKFFGSVLGFIGVGMVALPAGILASGFSEALHRRRHTLERDLSRALEDGDFDEQERSMLASRARSMSVSDEELADILQSQGRAHAASACCPHCGKPLAVAADPAAETVAGGRLGNAG
jgi:voltage-gated potassium channel